MTDDPGRREVVPFPKDVQVRRVWACKWETPDCARTAPCKRCEGLRNRRKGQRKQRLAARGIGVPAPKFASQMGHEELFGGLLRAEVKAGKQVGPVATRYLRAEAQSEGARAIGDTRPFVFLAMPDGWGNDGLFVCRITSLFDTLVALQEQLGQ